MTENRARRRKVLILAPPLQAIGGVQNYTRTLVAAFQEVLGADSVRVVAVSGEPEARDDGNFALPLRVKIRFVASVLAAAISWSPDLIVCAHVGVAPVARHIQKLTRVPYWTVLYGIEVWGRLPRGKRNALHAAQRLISITRFTLDATIARQSLHGPRALILPPTLPKGQMSSPRPDGAPSENSQRPIVLTVGRISALERYKGHDVILDAWPFVLRRVPAAEYWIVGGGDDRPRLESRAQELGIATSVRFLGSVSPEELAVCYDKCCVFAMPATTELDADTPRGEGFGIVFLEAMVRGKPVLGPRVGAPAEFIRSGEHGLLVDPANATEVASALTELLEDHARAQQMGAAGREWVLREFSFEKFCERLREGLQA
jgi:phosphatidylinositol alpha-1,6-mannosyltransferase